jgi:hypothetical protein
MTINPYLLVILKTLFNIYKKKFLIWLIQQDFYRKFVLDVMPKLRLSTTYTTMKGWKYRRGYKLLMPGDIVLTVDRRSGSTVVIGGMFSHAGQCVGKDSDVECLEMTHENFLKSTFSDMAYHADRVVIIRCVDYDEAYIKKLCEKALSFEGAKYDTEFHLNNKFLYCSELVYEADFERRLQVNLEDLAGIGNQYISPTGLYRAKNIRIIWDSDNEIR